MLDTDRDMICLLCTAYFRRHPQLFLLLCSVTVWGASPLCPSQPITATSLCLPCLVVEQHYSAGEDVMDSQHVSVHELQWSSCHQSFLNKCRQWQLPLQVPTWDKVTFP